MVDGKVAVFVSEDPRLLEEVIDEADLVVSDRSDLGRMVPDKKFFQLGHSEKEILQLLKRKGVSAGICLGYRRLFSKSFLEQVGCEMYNLHPSLLPAFKGIDVYTRIIDRGIKISGATLHKVSEEMDEGEIIDQVSYRVPEDVSVNELKYFARQYELELLDSFLEK